MDELLTVTRAEALLAEVEKAYEPETQHIAEDALYQEVLRAIAENRCESPQRAAAIAMKAAAMDFPRWYS